jgi:hypothetical protein
LILSADGSGILKWWMDASFVVYPNLRGHSGAGLSVVEDFPLQVPQNKKSAIAALQKQILSAWTISCRLDVGRDTFLPHKGIMSETTFFFKTTRARFFWKKWQSSSCRRTRHINIRSFFNLCQSLVDLGMVQHDGDGR